MYRVQLSLSSAFSCSVHTDSPFSSKGGESVNDLLFHFGKSDVVCFSKKC